MPFTSLRKSLLWVVLAAAGCAHVKPETKAPTCTWSYPEINPNPPPTDLWNIPPDCTNCTRADTGAVSPLNLANNPPGKPDTKVTVVRENPQFPMPPSRNEDNTFAFYPTTPARILVGDTLFTTISFHLHTTAEHYPAEVGEIHIKSSAQVSIIDEKTGQSKTATVYLVFAIPLHSQASSDGDPNAQSIDLTPVLAAMRGSPGARWQLPLSDFMRLDYYYYKGTLTTPPCSPDIWFAVLPPQPTNASVMDAVAAMLVSRAGTLNRRVAFEAPNPTLQKITPKPQP